MFRAAGALEQERHRRAPGPFVGVVGGHQGQGGTLAADTADDLGEDLPEFGRDQQQPLRVGLGRRDLQHRHDFAGARQFVGDEAVVGEFGQLLDANAGVAKNLDGRPAPERAFLFEGEVTSATVGQIGDVDPPGGIGPADESSATFLEHLARRDGQRCVKPGAGGLALLLGCPHECGQDRQARPGALIHGGLMVLALLFHGAFAGVDRARSGPPRPSTSPHRCRGISRDSAASHSRSAGW